MISRHQPGRPVTDLRSYVYLLLLLATSSSLLLLCSSYPLSPQHSSFLTSRLVLPPSSLLPIFYSTPPVRAPNQVSKHSLYIMRNLSSPNLRAQAHRRQYWEVDDVSVSSSPWRRWVPNYHLPCSSGKSFVNLTVESPSTPAPVAAPTSAPREIPRKGPSKSSEITPEDYTKPFLDFINGHPTVFHAVDFFANRLKAAGFTKLSERDSWASKLKHGGKYFVTRNGSSLIAFAIPLGYSPGKGAGIVVGHIDALTAKLKPVSKKPDSHGYVQLGVAPYAGALNSTWWDRDLGVGGRVVVKNSHGKIETKLVKLDYPIARIPTLAPHFGIVASGPFNKETQMVPIVGLERYLPK